MFVSANPDKERTPEEKEEMKGKYTPGENVMLKVEPRERTLRERRVDDADERLINEVRELSLREVGVESTRRAASHDRRVRTTRESSRDSRNAGSGDRRRRHADSDTEVRERRRRHARSDADVPRHRRDDNATSRPEAGSSTDRRIRHNEESARRRHEETSRSAARQIEHQSSLRSLISSSDVDSYEMEEEILRQIREEGLLDGIDLENIDVHQEDQISERIAEAFRRRQNTRQAETSGRSSASSTRPSESLSAPRSRTNSRDRRNAAERRIDLRPGNGRSQSDEQARASTTRLEVQSPDGSRRRRGLNGNGRRATSPIPARNVPSTRPTARSQTDLSDQPRVTSQTQQPRPFVPLQTRSTNETPPNRADLHLNDQHVVETTSSPREIGHGFQATSTDIAPTSSTTRVPPQTSLSIRPPNSTSLTDEMDDQSLIPAPLSPRGSRHSVTDKDIARSSSAERALALGSASRPTSSSSAAPRVQSPLFQEPSITCSRCSRPHIEYEIHYNCDICHEGNWNICISCYRSGQGCLRWFGFGNAAWAKWERELAAGLQTADSEKPHTLAAYRYLPPKSSPGGADGRKTLTHEDPATRLQSGAFCMSCLAWANECYWRCDICNEGDWGFCNLCVNQGKCCTHPLLPLQHTPSETNVPTLAPSRDEASPPSATILTGPGVREFGAFKPLTFRTKCDICHHSIQPTQTRYHCFSCTSTVPGACVGDYDICNTCYGKLVSSKRISIENGHQGWRRCLNGHRMVIIGFEDRDGGQRRLVFHDLVGGRSLKQDPYHGPKLGLQLWTWAEGSQIRLVTDNVMETSPSSAEDLTLSSVFPPDGGVGKNFWAKWSWYPKEGTEGDGELLFPRGAEIREVIDINGDWYWGVYGGVRALLPSPYVRLLNNGPAAAS